MFRVIETFSGIGSQAKALKNIRANFEIVAISEWDIQTIIAYSFIHHGTLNLSKYREMTEEERADFLADRKAFCQRYVKLIAAEIERLEEEAREKG